MASRVANVFCSMEEVPAANRLVLPVRQTHYLLDGEMKEWHGKFTDVMSPICMPGPDGRLAPTKIGETPMMTEADALAAVEACSRAWDSGKGQWPTMTTLERIECIERFTNMMLAQRQTVVNLLMWEICKNSEAAAAEFDRTIKYIRDTIDAVKDLDRSSSRFAIEEGIFAQIRRAPLGVALCMGPFNYPLNETFTTVIPALIMGNCVVFKTPKMGGLALAPILECFQRALPRGVVNPIHGEGRVITHPVIASGKVDVLAFIGTSKAADTVRKQHPLPHRLRCVLGLDAKNPAIVLPCADVELAVKECMLGALSFNGQRCTAIKLIFVHKDIAPRFTQRLCEEVAKLTIGLPWKGCSITPLPEKDKTTRMKEFIDDAVAKGAELANALYGGGESNATIMVPAVVSGVTPAMKLFHEEQFGPIVPISVFNEIDEPLQFIRESPYGQQVAVFGTNPSSLAHLVDPLANQVCRININSQCQRGPDVFPFTGRKDSAEMTLSVSDALRCFSIRTLVAAKATPLNKQIVTTILHNRQSHFLSTDFLL